jgi:hypothetical protein
MQCVTGYFVQLLSETFLILRGTEPVGLYVKYPSFSSEFNENLIFYTGFRKILKYKIS